MKTRDELRDEILIAVLPHMIQQCSYDLTCNLETSREHSTGVIFNMVEHLVKEVIKRREVKP